MTSPKEAPENRGIGRLYRAFGEERRVRILAVEATKLAEHTRLTHELGPDAAKLAGEGLVATALLSAQVKGEERISLQLQASQPEASFFGEFTGAGHVRARVSPANLRLRNPALNGILLAIKSIDGRELYRGVSEVVAKPLDEALATHFETSQQVDVVLKIGVEQAKADGRITFAGGIVIERLPHDANFGELQSEAFKEQFSHLHEVTVPEVLLRFGMGKLGSGAVEILEERELRWICTCSRERVSGMLRCLGAEELSDMLKKDKQAEISCHLCNYRYLFLEEELSALLSSLPTTEP